jgi:soluble lytic murein transglycosylase-like protein
MLKEMRKTVAENPLVPASFGESIYTGMLDDEYSKLFASNGTLGLSDSIARELDKKENPESALKELAQLNSNPWATDPRFIANQSVAQQASTNSTNADSVARWEPLIALAGSQYGVDKNLLAAVVAQESGGNPHAVSPKGAKGLMQLMDTTAAEMGVTAPFSPWANLAGGAKYLRLLLDKYDGNEALALASYNAGPAAVDRYGGVPPYEETNNYVASVLNLKNQLANQSTGEKQ